MQVWSQAALANPIVLYDNIVYSSTRVGRVAQSVERMSYGLDGPESNPGGGEIFRSSRPVLGPTQPPVKWVPCISPWGKVRPGRAADHSPPSSAAVMEKYSYTSAYPLGHKGPLTGSDYRFYPLQLHPVSVSVTICKTRT